MIDFRHLNVRIVKNSLAYPLLKNTFSVLGNSKCEVLSVLDLKDPFHSLRLSENSKKYSGILPYFGSISYLYKMMPMGLNISPSRWQSYINGILDHLQSKNTVKQSWVILCCLFPQKVLIWQIRRFIKSTVKNGLKISPKKCQLLRTNLNYVANEIFIQNKRVCMKPL